RRAGDSDFCLVRVGVGTRPLATRLVPPEAGLPRNPDPVTATALHRFLSVHSAIADVPIAHPLRAGATVTIDGDPTRARALLRAMISQLTVLHAPDQLLIAGVVSEQNRADWEWLKWLPHNQHPRAGDGVGSARMVYPTLAQAENALRGIAGLTHVVVVSDL